MSRSTRPVETSHSFGRPVVTLAKPGTECVMVLSEDKRSIAAILIPEQIHIGLIEHLYAIGNGVFSEGVKLAAMWKCWAVLCDPAWGDQQIKARAPRPAGAKFFFVS